MNRAFTSLLCSALLPCFALIVSGAGCAGVYRQTDVPDAPDSPGGQFTISYFYDSLAPYGQWFPDPPYGWCWTPYDVSSDWRPYSDGHWEYTDYGWSWASNEPWGWAPYHYGRWFFDDSYGWVWVPGTDWAPAWVAWRSSDDWAGWAPLPPTADWDDTGGLALLDVNSIPAYEWCFAPEKNILDAKLRVHIAMVAHNVTLIKRSRDATRFELRDGRPADIGVDIVRVERNVGRHVPPVRIIDVNEPANGRGQQVGRDGVGFFRPRVRPAPSGQAPPPSMMQGRDAIPDNILQRQGDEQQRKLESDLKAEEAQLERDQRNELRAQKQGSSLDEIRAQQATEREAFEAHAAMQRRVLAQRMQKHVAKPGKARVTGKR